MTHLFEILALRKRIRKVMNKLILILFLLILITSNAVVFAETIKLKSGASFEGAIIELTDGHVTIDRGKLGTFRIDFSEIDDQTLTVLRTLPKVILQEHNFSNPTAAVNPIDSYAGVDIPKLLKARGYPENSWPNLERELKIFLEKINLPNLQKKAVEAKKTPEGIRDLAQELGRAMERLGYINHLSPPPLIKGLIDSLGDEDVETVVGNGPHSDLNGELSREDYFACTVLSQLGLIVFELLDIDARVTVSPGHVFITASNSAGKIVFIDILNLVFEIVDLGSWYRPVSQVWILKDEYRLPWNMVGLLRINHQMGRTKAPEVLKEKLNMWYPFIFITQQHNATTNIYNNRGLAYYQRGDLNRALAEYDQALAIDPNNVEAHSNRTIVYTIKKDFNRALADINEALTINPNDAEVYNNRGNVYNAMEDLNRALMDYNEAINYDPSRALFYLNRGGVYFQMKDFNRSIEDFNQGLSINPNYGDVYYWRGLAFTKIKDFSRALDDMNKAQTLGVQVSSKVLEELHKAAGR